MMRRPHWIALAFLLLAVVRFAFYAFRIRL